MFVVIRRLALCFAVCVCLPPAMAAPAPIRFLLTFDDGPSAAESDNPTGKILSALEDNPIQPGIKAVFFTQTRAANGGGTDVGRRMLEREFTAGHVLALHTATPGHTNHRKLEPAELEASIERGMADIASVTGQPPSLVRPPFWNYDERTMSVYEKYGLKMLLTDMSANDGVIHFYNFSLNKRRNMYKLLKAARARWEAGALPEVDGQTPIVVTFHDVNSYTANNIKEYLNILVDVAKELDVPLTERPFYDERGQLERAAKASAGPKPELPGIWSWIWK